ncbi:MAG: rhomboid family intramembrane serine protease [Bacteroidaceae bacterium]|nr:rhomboid family intramembrane serine protease [Bacteroidaceae bacterium]
MKSIVNILLVINIVAYFADQMLGLSGFMGLHFFASPFFHWFQPITYMFMHAGFMHIFFNMFALWMFGRFLEKAWGNQRFLIYYFVCGIGAAIVQEAGQLFGFIEPYATTIGASGAVYGILLAFGMTFPEERIFIFPIPIPIKAKYFVLIYVAIELLEGFGANDGVAHFAHLGGMLFGALLFIFWKSKTRTIHNVRKMKVTYNKVEKSQPYNYRYDYSTTTSSPTNTSSYTQNNGAEIDRILDKIRHSGYDKLTAEEKETLFNASKK